MFSRFQLRLALVALLALALAALLVPPAVTRASSLTLTVDDDKAQCPNASFSGPSAIQAAINAIAASPDRVGTVQVCPGTYAPLVLAVATPNPETKIVLTSLPAFANSLPVIDAKGTGKPAIKVISQNNELNVQNLKVKGDSGSNSAAIEADTSYLRLTNVRVSGGRQGVWGYSSVAAANGSLLVIDNSNISHADNAGVYSQGACHLYLTNSSVQNNGVAGVEAGSCSKDAAGPLIQKNTIVHSGIGILLDQASNTLVSGNVLKDNTDGIALVGQSGDNEIVGNAIRGSQHNGITVDASSKNNLFRGNVVKASGQADIDDETVQLGGWSEGNTFNIWSGNACTTSAPQGLCALAPDGVIALPPVVQPLPTTTAP